MRTSVRTIYSLLRHQRNLAFQAAYGHAQTAYVVARAMGGFEGDVTAFIPPWASLKPLKRRSTLPRAIVSSIHQALAAHLVSQDALDLLIDAGFEP